MVAKAPGEYVVLAAQFAAAETAAGKVVRVDLSSIPDLAEGRPVHLAGFRIDCTAQFDKVAATMPTAMPGELFYAAIGSINLRAENHFFLQGVDGFDVLWDWRLRSGKTHATYPSDPADADATNATQAISLSIRFNNPSAPPEFRKDGLIPVGLFGRGGANLFEFTVQQNLRGFPGLTIDDLGAMKIWAILEVTDDLRVPSPWRLTRVNDPSKDARIDIRGGLEYLVINDPQDSSNAWDFSHDDYSGIEVTMGNTILFAGRTALELAIGHNIRRNQRGVTDVLSETVPEIVPILTFAVDTPRSELPRGRVRVRFDTRSDHSSSTYLYRETGELTDGLVSEWAQRLGAPYGAGGVAAGVRTKAAKDSVKANRIAGILDHQLVFPGAPGT